MIVWRRVDCGFERDDEEITVIFDPTFPTVTALFKSTTIAVDDLP